MSSNNEGKIGADLIPWSTRDAALLPFYGGAISLTLLTGVPNILGPYPETAVFPVLTLIFLTYRLGRALEAHGNLKRLKKLDAELRGS